MTERKFYKTILQVEILSEEPVQTVDLESIHHQITEGDWSGNTEIVSQTTLNGKEAAEALLNQASDPKFFNLTENGDDAEL